MKKSFRISHFAFHILIAVSVILAEEFIPISAMHESGSIVNTTFFNAGGAFPATASSASLNPSIPAAWHFFSQSKMSVFGSFYKTGNKTEYFKTGGGASLALGRGKYVSAEYNLKNEKTNGYEQKFNRITTAFGMTLDDSEEDPLFTGINISYFNYNNRSGENFACAEFPYRDTKYNFIAADVGFYQPGDGKGLGWGIVLENILGYVWDYHKPYKQNTQISVPAKTEDGEETVIVRDTSYYVFEAKKTRSFLNKRYNSFLLSTNISVPMLENKIVLMIPADVRFWGFMNKDLRKSSKLKYRTEVHSGFELQVGRRLCGRFGWAWIPHKYTTAEDGQLNFSGWDNRFSGGFGINIGPVTIDALFAKETIGADLSFRL